MSAANHAFRREERLPVVIPARCRSRSGFADQVVIHDISREGCRVGLLATQATVESGRYEALVRTLDAGVTVTSVACPRLVSRIERDAPFGPETALSNLNAGLLLLMAITIKREKGSDRALWTIFIFSSCALAIGSAPIVMPPTAVAPRSYIPM